MAKLKATENKAKDIETNPKVEKLWAQFGQLQANRERLNGILQATTQQMREVYAKLQKCDKGLL